MFPKVAPAKRNSPGLRDPGLVMGGKPQLRTARTMAAVCEGCATSVRYPTGVKSHKCVPKKMAPIRSAPCPSRIGATRPGGSRPAWRNCCGRNNARASGAGRKPLTRARAIEVIAKPRAVCIGHPRLLMQHRLCGPLLLCLVSTNRICMVL
jgi:hypothetical protein